MVNKAKCSRQSVRSVCAVPAEICACHLAKISTKGGEKKKQNPPQRVPAELLGTAEVGVCSIAERLLPLPGSPSPLDLP